MGQSQTFDYYSTIAVRTDTLNDFDAKSKVFDLTFSTNLNEGEYDRTIYSLLNLLGDVGGL